MSSIIFLIRPSSSEKSTLGKALQDSLKRDLERTVDYQRSEAYAADTRKYV